MTKSGTETAQVSRMVLTLRLGDNLHAIPSEAVEEVLPALPVEPVPDCPAFVRGVVFVRGQLIPVLDAAERLGLKEHQRALEPHIVCLRIDDRLIGVEFDEALDLMDLGTGESLASSEIGIRTEFVSGVVEREGRIIRLLDPEKLIHWEEVMELENVPRTG